jgi:hypothetical protein
MDQYLEDQVWQIAEKCTAPGNRHEAKKCFGESKRNGVSASNSHDFDQLAEDARELWEELRPREPMQDRRLDSCCTSICSTVASAASTVSSSTFSSLCPESSPAHGGSTPSFSMDCRGLSTMTLCTQTSCAATSCPAEEATPFIDDPARALAAADAAVAAATYLLRRALARRDAAASDPKVAATAVALPRPAAAELEELTLGPGWPARP